MMFEFVFMASICFALLGVSCCALALVWGIIEDTELGQFIIMKITNKHSG